MAVLSAVDIANLALSHVGQEGSIESLSEESAEAKECNRWYDQARREALGVHDWSFARKRQVLTLHGDDAPQPWAYRYQYPADCVRFRLISNPAGVDEDAVPFEIEMSEDGTQKTILTDMNTATGVYTFDQLAPGVYTEFFVDLLALSLARRIAVPLTAKDSVFQRVNKWYNRARLVAPAQDENERVDRKPREAEHIRARR